SEPIGEPLHRCRAGHPLLSDAVIVADRLLGAEGDGEHGFELQWVTNHDNATGSPDRPDRALRGRLTRLVDEQPAEHLAAQVAEDPVEGGERGGDDRDQEEQRLPRGERLLRGEVGRGLAGEDIDRAVQALPHLLRNLGEERAVQAKRGKEQPAASPVELAIQPGGRQLALSWFARAACWRAAFSATAAAAWCRCSSLTATGK